MNIGIHDLLPHRPPMLMVDRLVSVDTDAAEAVKTFRDGDYGTSDGTVLEPCLIECMAQTVAAMKGYGTRVSGRAPRPGMLVGVDGVDVVECPSCGEELRTAVRVLTEVGTFSLAEGEVRCGGRVVAAGKLKLYEEEAGGEANA
ncbi:MAG: hypothetical protein GY851_01015 [bacterium]|nr:hypothetical protein [bacterium]